MDCSEENIESQPLLGNDLEYRAEPNVAGHHPLECCLRLFERKPLDHRPNTVLLGERDRIRGVGGGS